MRKNNNTNTVEAPEQVAVADAPIEEAAPKKKRTTRSLKKVVAPVKEEETKIVEIPVATETPIVENETTETLAAEEPKAKAETEPEEAAEMQEQKTVDRQEVKANSKAERKTEPKADRRPEAKPIPKIASDLVIKDFCDLANSGSRIPLLKDDQIQQLTLDEAVDRYMTMEAILANVLDYDIVLSDTNIWLELLVGHISSHSDPRVNARLQFERQLEFISKMMKRIGGRFLIMSETYEEIDRFASIQEPTNYKDADWTDEVLCRNVAARLAKRLMLSQQKENRLRIVGICSECHHGAFADPAIIRYTVELFAQGKKVLLLTNDASVGIRSLGMCDDLQRINDIDDKTWREVYEPQRPMVLTMDDLKLLDSYTRQYYYLTMAAGHQWMQYVDQRESITLEKPLSLWLDGFRPGDRHERRSDRIDQQRREERERAEQQRREREEQRKAKQKNNKKGAQQPAPAAQPTQEAAVQPAAETNETPKAVQAGNATASKQENVSAQKQENTPANKKTATDGKPQTPAPSEEPKAESSTEAAAQPTSEETPVAFGATAEMMDLIGPQPGEKKSRTRRSTRRRSSGNKKKTPTQE